MESIGRYILSVITAAMILGILRAIVSQKGGAGTLFRLIGGLFLTFTIINPITNINLADSLNLPQHYMEQGSYYAECGTQTSRQQLEAIIKQQCEAYILDKARSCQAQLDVDITLSQDDLPKPESVTLKGHASPYQRRLLQHWLEEDLGIQGAYQIWSG